MFWQRHKYGLIIFTFLILLLLSLSVLGKMFLAQDDSGGGFRTFYSEQEDIDVMIFGSSHAACTINNAQLFKEDGIASYTLSAGAQTIPQTYWYMKEAFAFRKPKVALVETYLAAQAPMLAEESNANIDSEAVDEAIRGELYRSDLSMRFSPRYVQMVLTQARDYRMSSTLYNALLLKWPFIHSRYAELGRESLENTTQYIRGYKGNSSVYGVDLRPEVTEDRQPVSPLNLRYISKIIELCRKSNVQLVFFTAPYPCTMDEMARENTIQDLAEKSGVPFYNFNTMTNQLGMDFSTDLRDDGNHLNNRGAAKVTAAMEEILKKYELPDRRESEGYDKWYQHQQWLDNKAYAEELAKTTDMMEYSEKLAAQENQYIVLISMTGNYDAQGVAQYQEALLELGIDAGDYQQGGTAIFDHGRLRWYSGQEKLFQHQEDTRGRRLFVEQTESGAGAWLGQMELTVPENGFSVLVYDDELDQIVDQAYMDVYETTELTHISRQN